MRSAAAMAAVTALFAGTLVGGLSYLEALDPAMLRGPQKDQPGAARAGWRTRSLEAAGFSIQLPPEWELANATPVVVFEARKGKEVLATLRVAPAAANARERRSAARKTFLRGGRTLTFETTPRRAPRFAEVFAEAAATFKSTRSPT
jgi:hypothetical protein